jgi:hypothetical protein
MYYRVNLESWCCTRQQLSREGTCLGSSDWDAAAMLGVLCPGQWVMVPIVLCVLHEHL